MTVNVTSKILTESESFIPPQREHRNTTTGKYLNKINYKSSIGVPRSGVPRFGIPRSGVPRSGLINIKRDCEMPDQMLS